MDRLGIGTGLRGRVDNLISKSRRGTDADPANFVPQLPSAGTASAATSTNLGLKSGPAAQRTRLAFAIGCALALAALVALPLLRSEAAAAADSCPNTELRQGVASHLPDCRAYEQVSPTDKNGFSVEGIVENGDGGPVGEGGGAVAFKSPGAFADSPFGGGGTLSYLARRDQHGWSTTALFPLPAAFGIGNLGVLRFGPEMSTSLIQTSFRLTPDPGGAQNFYLRENASGASTSFLTSTTDSRLVAKASRDLDTLVFTSRDILTDEADQPPAPTTKLYAFQDGQLRLVSRRPDGTPFQTSVALGSTIFPDSTEGAVSDDGGTVFFSSPPSRSSRVIYRRSAGVTTVASPSRRTPVDPDGTKRKDFHVATGDGNRVFFTSLERLTDDANSAEGAFDGDLYRYDFAADQLVDVSAGTAGDAKADVQGILDISESGDRVYFAALGQVVPGEGDPDPTIPKLYLWEDDGTPQGVTRFIATLHPESPGTSIGSDGGEDADNWARGQRKSAQASADGAHLVFRSRAPLTGYDNRQAAGSTSCDPTSEAAPNARCAEVYVYDAEANDGAGKLTCVSCDLGASPTGPAIVAREAGGLGEQYPRLLSDDGRRVFFSSSDPLLPRDTNGRIDAYMWEDDAVHLLSTGTSSDDSYAYGASADGDDAFFRTREQLVPADGDTLIDLYTAHVEGGLESQQDNAPPDCEGDGCQGAGTPAPEPGNPGSGDYRGAGNVAPAAEPKDCSKPAKRAQRAKRKAKRTKQRLKRTRRKARRADGKRERRLERRLERKKTKAKQAKRKAKRAQRRARRCKRANR